MDRTFTVTSSKNKISDFATEREMWYIDGKPVDMNSQISLSTNSYRPVKYTTAKGYSVTCTATTNGAIDVDKTLPPRAEPSP